MTDKSKLIRIARKNVGSQPADLPADEIALCPASGSATARSKTPSQPAPPAPPKTRRTEILIRALSRKRPPSLAQISSTLGWQKHTTRAAISRLRKSGVNVETLRSTTGGMTTYRIVPKDGAPSDAVTGVAMSSEIAE